MRTRTRQKGVAMVLAIVLALVVSVLVAGVLSLTMRRFELSAFRTDHAVAAATAEAGLQYAFARLDQDPVFRAAVNAKAPDYYVIYCHANPSFPAEYRPVDAVVDQRIHMGNKHLAVRIRRFTNAGAGDDTNPLFAARPYKVRAVAVFGTGGP